MVTQVFPATQDPPADPPLLVIAVYLVGQAIVVQAFQAIVVQAFPAIVDRAYQVTAGL